MRGDMEKQDTLFSGENACAPTNTGTRRKILKPSLADTAAPSLEEIDDSEERTCRNLNRYAEEATKYISPRGTPDRRKSVVSGAGMTNAQIAEHYSNCLKLSAENKINLKNAFDLHLIDIMSSMLLTNTDANFQTASSTLDAGAKIYAYRVDSLYKEAYKIYGGLGRGDKDAFTEEGGEVNDEIPTENAPPPTVQKKKKKKISRGSCIETNEKALNSACNEAKYQSDELFESVRAAFDEGNTSGLFLNTLSTFCDNNRLVLHSFVDLPSVSNVAHSEDDILDVFKGLLAKAMPSLSGPSTCDAVSNFDFCNWSFKPDDPDDFFANVDCLSGSDGGRFAAKGVEPMDVSFSTTKQGAENSYAGGATFEGEDLDDHDAEILNESIEIDAKVPSECKIKDDGQSAAKFKALEAALSTKDLEYSYFDPTLLQTWMGPNHWKVKKGTTKQEDPTAATGESQQTQGSGDQDAAKNAKGKRKGGKRKATHDERINFADKLDFKKILKTASKSSTVLSDSSLARHKTLDLSFEPDVDRQNPYNFNSLMLKPGVRISKSETPSNELLDDAALTDYNLESEADLENFCPNLPQAAAGVSHLDEDSQDVSFGEAPDYNEHRAAAEDDAAAGPSTAATSDQKDNLNLDATLTDANMVEQPYKVEKIDINYAKHAKRVDVKKLKSALWRMLTQVEGHDESISRMDVRQAPAFEQKLFSKIYQELPKHVSSQMMQNLTTHTVFTVLLHMCNEKNLQLEGESDFSDVKILQA